MLKVISILVTWYIAFYVISKCLKRLNDEYLKEQEKEYKKKSCIGCKHLDYYNDGRACCTKGLDNTCYKTGFAFKETDNE